MTSVSALPAAVARSGSGHCSRGGTVRALRGVAAHAAACGAAAAMSVGKHEASPSAKTPS